MALQNDEQFHERAALDEIDLYSELLIAASQRGEPLPKEEVDLILGLPKKAE